MKAVRLIYRFYHIVSRNKSNVWATWFLPDCNLLESHASEGIEEIIAPKRCYRPPFCQHPLYQLLDLKTFCTLAFAFSSRSLDTALHFFTEICSLATIEVQ